MSGSGKLKKLQIFKTCEVFSEEDSGSSTAWFLRHKIVNPSQARTRKYLHGKLPLQTGNCDSVPAIPFQSYLVAAYASRKFRFQCTTRWLAPWLPNTFLLCFNWKMPTSSSPYPHIPFLRFRFWFIFFGERQTIVLAGTLILIEISKLNERPAWECDSEWN